MRLATEEIEDQASAASDPSSLPGDLPQVVQETVPPEEGGSNAVDTDMPQPQAALHEPQAALRAFPAGLAGTLEEE